MTRFFVVLCYIYNDELLQQKILGIKFKNPVGLSAGFDKNAEIINVIGSMGFGFSEVGSVTALACEGNKGKRLERIKEKKSLWVNLGLNNDGADEISGRLQGKKFRIPFGISVAKTNCKENKETKKGIEDYVYSLKKFNDLNIGNFFVLNISCPNSFGGRDFGKPKLYKLLLDEIGKVRIKKPIFVKLSPDLGKKEIDKIVEFSRKKIDGFIVSNLTKKHEIGKGGLSGKYLEKRANELLRYIHKKGKGEFVLVGVGGIFSAEDAYEKIKAGASLVELITGMIYEGPGLIGEINYGLKRLLEKEGYKNISQAVGQEIRKDI